jgi:uncharacterized protein YyaL (SSP411 family)
VNRLARALSPYLRQHAENPVEWFEWSDEALDLAKRDDKPILLSIGYSACHWCHVMEKESFSDDETASLMNELFVSIKVDREERPDLDQIYQAVVQLTGRSGGWPLTVFLTPDKKPFFAGTYFPPVERYGMPAFRTVLRAVHQAWADRRSEVLASAVELANGVAEALAGEAERAPIAPDFLETATRQLARRFDDEHGGFGTRPKFPNTMSLELFLRLHAHSGDAASLERVRRALDGMREGGIYDQIGGGFHRYSTDERWLVPHFEKMLYDNALLVRLYADGYRVTGEARYRDTARATLAYMERELLDSRGGFYSSQDADSEGEEGRFFVWTPEQIDTVLPGELGAIAKTYYGVAPGGNFEDTGASVLHVSRSIRAVAEQYGKSEDEIVAMLPRIEAALFAARDQREKPFRDEKIIAAWNGLAIGAFAESALALGEECWLAIAIRGLAFVRSALFQSGDLRRIALGDEVTGDGYLEDYANVACAALDVFEASRDGTHLGFARELVDRAIVRFADEQAGGFYFAPARDDLIVRVKDAYDNAVPSGTSAMCHALLRLAAATGESSYELRAQAAMESLAKNATAQPFGFGHLLGAMDRWVRGSTEIAIVAARADTAGLALFRAASSRYVPNRSLVSVDPAAGEPLPAFLGERSQVGGAATAYVCTNRVCSAPVTTPEALTALLAERM